MKYLYFIFILVIADISISEAKDCIPNRKFELIKNGDFELGDTLFSSDYSYSNRGKTEKTYAITNNPYLNYSEFDSCGDKTTGFTNMMIVNGDTIKGSIVWQQLVSSIEKGIDYEFSFWFCSIKDLRPAVLLVLINDDTLKPHPIYVSDSSCYWLKTTYVWNSGSVDTANIRIYDEATNFFGNDFALDDISMMPYCRVQACAGQTLYTCKNVPIALSAGAEDGQEPYRFNWSPGAFLDNPNIQTPQATLGQTTKFFLEVTDSRNCVSYDTIDVIVHDEPDNTITSSHQMPACPCETVTLSAPQGMKYLWSNSETSRQINTNEPGIYTVEIEDSFGCKSIGSFELIHKQLNLDMSFDTLYSSTGKDISIQFKTLGAELLNDCGYTDFTAKVKYNSTLLVPRAGTPFGSIENGYETITINGKVNELKSNPLSFFTVWGNAPCTDISIEEVIFDCDSISTLLSPGLICLDDLCMEGGTRLFDARENAFLSVNNFAGTLVSSFYIPEEGYLTLLLNNYSGEQLDIIRNVHFKAGTYESEFYLGNLVNGVYFVTLHYASSVITKPIIIIN